MELKTTPNPHIIEMSLRVTEPLSSKRNRYVGLFVPILLFPAFALAVYSIQGPFPTLSPDHVSYMEQADAILHEYGRNALYRGWTSNQGLGVLLAYLLPITGSYIISLKVILFVNTIMFLWAFLLFTGLYCADLTIRTFICCIAAMSVSFGVTSWGLTDSAAFLGRSLGLPWIVLCLWLYFRFYSKWQRFLALPLLVLVSLMHLGSYHVFGALVILEVAEIAFVRRRLIVPNTLLLLISLSTSFGLLIVLEKAELSPNLTSFIFSEIFPPGRTREFVSTDADLKQTPAERKSLLHDFVPLPTNGGAINPLVLGNRLPKNADSRTPLQKYTPQVAWAAELSLRGWRNMPLPMINVVNILSSVFVILMLAALGLLNTRVRAFTNLDGAMAMFAGSIVVCSFLPQTILWVLRSRWPIYPVNFEEIRTLSWIMIPCIYFSYVLFARGSDYIIQFTTSNRARAVLIIAFLAVPLTLRAFSVRTREELLQCALKFGIVSRKDPASVLNAREALGISHEYRYYYDLLPVEDWIRTHLAPNSLVLTDRDELVLSHVAIIGSRQQAVLANPQDDPLQIRQVFYETKAAMESRNLGTVLAVARRYGANYILVPWSIEEAAYHDDHFSVIKVPTK